MVKEKTELSVPTTAEPGGQNLLRRPLEGRPGDTDTPNRAVSAVLLHGYCWGAPDESLCIAPGVELCTMEGSPVAALYDGLCRVRGADDGEPFDYQMYVRLRGPHSVVDVATSESWPSLSRLFNAITIVTENPLTMVRLINSTDNFKTVDATKKAFLSDGQAELLARDWPVITGEVGQSLATVWATADAAWERAKCRGRLFRALENFFYAWRSTDLDQTCLNLGTCLAVLFAPDRPQESPQPIIEKAVALAGQSASNDGEPAEILGRLFELRTRVIFGDDIHVEPDMDVTVVQAFHLVAALLRSVLLDPPLARKLDGCTVDKVRGSRRSRTVQKTKGRASHRGQ